MKHRIQHAGVSKWVGGVALLVLGAACSSTIDGPGSSGTSGAGNGAGTGSGATAGTGQGGSSGASGAAGTGTGAAPTGGSSGQGGGPPLNDFELGLDGTPIYSRFVRLTHRQWENSVRDLFSFADVPGISSTFTSDPPEGSFSNNERALFVSPNLRGDYQRAAEAIAVQVARDPAVRTTVTRGADAATFVRDFGRRAYRRPLAPDEAGRYDTLFASGAMLIASGDAFADGVEIVLRAFLQSPHFVYRTELGAEGAPLSGYESAARLSLLIADTTPSDALLDAAGRGELDTPQGVVAAATSLLDGAAARAVLGRYHEELLGLDRYLTIEKDRTLFPSYTDTLNPELVQADRLFFERILTQSLGLREILQSRTAFVTAGSARFYGITAPATAYQEVELGPERAGFFTRLGYLAYNANLREPDPIHRGVDFIQRVLCRVMAPPVGEIPPLPATMPGQTNRERVDAHTGSGECAGCHAALINPIGFAFENFDAMGQARTMDNGRAVDTTGQFEFPDGVQAFAGAPELMALFAESAETHACYARHLAEFALGRDIAEADRPLVNRLEDASLFSNASLKQILLAVTESSAFTTHVGGQP